MNEQEYAALQEYSAPSERLSAAMLYNRKRRTLIWGYDTERNSFHVYIGDDDKIHIVSYSFGDYLLSHKTEDTATPPEYVPNKRVYPAACDLQFCKLLIQADVRIPFTTFEARGEEDFYGKRLEELIVVPADFRAPEVQLSLAELGLPEDLPMLQYPHLCEALEQVIVKDVADFMSDAARRVRFKGEDPARFGENIARRLAFCVRQFGIENEFYEDNAQIRPDIVSSAMTTLVPRVVSALETVRAN